jgi:hypothetical protein
MTNYLSYHRGPAAIFVGLIVGKGFINCCVDGLLIVDPLPSSYGRREVLSCMMLSFPVIVGTPLSAHAASPLDAGEAIRRSAAKIPGYGQTDVFYPKSFAGTWTMTRDVEFNGRPDSTTRLTYPFRFIPSIEDDSVVADRGYNQAELEKAITRTIREGGNNDSDSTHSSPSGTRKYDYDWIQSNPNDLRITLSDGTRKEIKVTKRATERTDDTVSSSEFQRITQDDARGVPVISARRVVSKWKAVDSSTLEGIEIIYDMGGGDPLAEATSQTPSVLSKSRMHLTR